MIRFSPLLSKYIALQNFKLKSQQSAPIGNLVSLPGNYARGTPQKVTPPRLCLKVFFLPEFFDWGGGVYEESTRLTWQFFMLFWSTPFSLVLLLCTCLLYFFSTFILFSSIFMCLARYNLKNIHTWYSQYRKLLKRKFAGFYSPRASCQSHCSFCSGNIVWHFGVLCSPPPPRRTIIPYAEYFISLLRQCKQSNSYKYKHSLE